MGTAIVVRTQIRNYAKVESKTLNISNEFYGALNKKVQEMIEDACARAIANGRTTLMGRDV